MERSFKLDDIHLEALGISRGDVESALDGRLFDRNGLLITPRDPKKFIATFFAALDRGLDIWLASPSWSTDRMGKVRAIMRKTLIGGTLPEGGHVFIPTGGTTGRLRFAVHTWDTLANSARGFLEFYGSAHGHRTFCVLPLYHVSGLMQVVRVAIAGGGFYAGNCHDPSQNLPEDFNPDGCFISLVPTQLGRLLDKDGSQWMRNFETIVVGGAALDSSLAEAARKERLPLSPSYGMTETAAVVCALLPGEFLSGANGAGHSLPHAEISLEGDKTGRAPSEEAPGIVLVRASSACKGYADGNGFSPLDGAIRTSDLGWKDEGGILHIKGRADRVIVCGGEKIDPTEIEETLLSTRKVSDVAVIGIPDPKWGAIALCCYAASESFSDEAELKIIVETKFSRRHVPKLWKKYGTIPRNEAGKPDIPSILHDVF
jgi:o-succinylbenzoate---CoA ligase